MGPDVQPSGCTRGEARDNLTWLMVKNRQPGIVDCKNNEDGGGWTVDLLVVKLQGAVSQLPVNLDLVPTTCCHLMVAIEIAMMWTRRKGDKLGEKRHKKKKVTNLVTREKKR